MKLRLRHIYIFTTCLAMFMYLGLERRTKPWWWSSIHCTIWIVIGMFVYVRRNRAQRSKELRESILMICYAFGTPYFIFWIFTIIGWMASMFSGTFEIRFATRAISTTIQYILMLLSVASTAYIFRKKLLHYTFTAAVLNYTVVIIVAILKYGIGDFFRIGIIPFGEIASSWTPSKLNIAAYLEVHDVTFALAFFLLYFLYNFNEQKRQRIISIVFCIAFIYLGFKRIQLAALLLIVLMAIFVSQKSKKNMHYWINLFTVVMLLVSLSYVWLIDSDILAKLSENYGINFMGRLKVYAEMSKYFDFTLSLWGGGMSYGRKIGERLVENGVISFTGHSDILLSFMDYGFVGFFLWLFFICHTVPQKMNKSIEPKVARMWLFFTLYAIITYLTDNTSYYFAFQTSYMVVMFHVVYDSKMKRLQNSTNEGKYYENSNCNHI